MTNRSVTHSTFVLEREYAAPRERVFGAWSDPDAKAKWFGASDFELDFRIGGREINRGGPEGGPVFTYEASYQDIVDGERIVYTYDMLMDDTRISQVMSRLDPRLPLRRHLGRYLAGPRISSDLILARSSFSVALPGFAM